MTEEEQLELELENIGKALSLVTRLYTLKAEQIAKKLEIDAARFNATPEEIQVAKGEVQAEQLQILTTLKQMAEAFLEQGIK